MPDRETVIANIREDIDLLTYDRQSTTEELKIINDLSAAVAMLKEQEAVEPRVSTAEQRCGHCNKVIEMDGWIACPWCGKRIDWESWWSKNGNR